MKIEKLSLKLQKTYQTTLQRISSLTSTYPHLLLLFHDHHIIPQFLSLLKKSSNSLKFSDSLKSSDSLKISNPLKFYNLDTSKSALSRSLYELLDEDRSEVVVMYSVKGMCFDRLERRVRSRFRGECVVVPYLNKKFFEENSIRNLKNFKNTKNIDEVYNKSPTITSLMNYNLQTSLNINSTSSLHSFLQLLKPIHFCLFCIISKNSSKSLKSKKTSAFELFRNKTAGMPAFSKYTFYDIENYVRDLVDFGSMIWSRGILKVVWPYFEVETYVRNEMPVYVKNIL